MIYTYPNPDVRRKTDDRHTSAFSGTDKRLPGMDQGAEENIALNERFVARTSIVWVCRALKRLYTVPVIKVEPDIFSETVGAMDMYKEHFQGKTISVQSSSSATDI